MPTGFSFAYSEGFGGKLVEFLKEAVPAASRVAFLQHTDNLGKYGYVTDIQHAAAALGLTLQSFLVREPAIRRRLCADDREKHVGAPIVDTSTCATGTTPVIDLAAQYRLPAMYPFRHYVEAGGPCPMG